MIYIYAVSDSNKHFSNAIDEYTKRLWKAVTIHYLKPSKKDTADEIIKQEGKVLAQELSKKSGYKVLLYIGVKELATVEFYNFIESRLQTDANIIFVVWGAYGVSDEVIENIDIKISLSRMTFPHGMALMVLLEQLYRSSTIKQWKKYHH